MEDFAIVRIGFNLPRQRENNRRRILSNQTKTHSYVLLLTPIQRIASQRTCLIVAHPTLMCSHRAVPKRVLLLRAVDIGAPVGLYQEGIAAGAGEALVLGRSIACCTANMALNTLSFGIIWIIPFRTLIDTDISPWIIVHNSGACLHAVFLNRVCLRLVLLVGNVCIRALYHTEFTIKLVQTLRHARLITGHPVQPLRTRTSAFIFIEKLIFGTGVTDTPGFAASFAGWVAVSAEEFIYPGSFWAFGDAG